MSQLKKQKFLTLPSCALAQPSVTYLDGRLFIESGRIRRDVPRKRIAPASMELQPFNNPINSKKHLRRVKPCAGYKKIDTLYRCILKSKLKFLCLIQSAFYIIVDQGLYNPEKLRRYLVLVTNKFADEVAGNSQSLLSV